MKDPSSDSDSPKTYVGGLGVHDDTADTGLLYMRQRHYDPTLARFLSGDPIGFAGGLNLYGYVGGSPVNRIDPTGLDPYSKLWKVYRLWKESKHGAIAARSATRRHGSTLIGEVRPVDPTLIPPRTSAEMLNEARDLLKQAAGPEWGKKGKGSGIEIVGGTDEDVRMLSGALSDCGGHQLHSTDPKFADVPGQLHGHPASGPMSEKGSARLHVQGHPYKALIPAIVASILVPKYNELRTLDPSMESVTYKDLAAAAMWDAVEFFDPTITSTLISWGAGI